MYSDLEKAIEDVPMNMQDYDSLSRKVSQIRSELGGLEAQKTHIANAIKGKAADLDVVLSMVQSKKITKEVEARWFYNFDNNKKIRQWVTADGEVINLYERDISDKDRQLKLPISNSVDERAQEILAGVPLTGSIVFKDLPEEVVDKMAEIMIDKAKEEIQETGLAAELKNMKNTVKRTKRKEVELVPENHPEEVEVVEEVETPFIEDADVVEEEEFSFDEDTEEDTDI